VTSAAWRRRARSRAATALLVGGAFACGAFAQNRAVFVDVEIRGPVDGVVLDVGAAGATRIEGALSSGETRRLSVPVPLASESVRVEPRVRIEGAAGDLEGRGGARFVAWRGGPPPLANTSPGLRARARPAIAPATVVVSRAAVLVLVAAFLSVFAVRRRPAWAIAIAALACAATVPLVRAPARDAESTVTVLDGDASRDTWRRVDAACDEITVPDGVEAFELATDPPAAPVTWIVSVDPAGAWRARASGARLFLASEFPAGEERITRAHNHHAELDATWVREDGQWRPHGAWRVDAPLPAPIEDAGSTGGGTPTTSGTSGGDRARDGAEPPTGMPPGWLLGALPQGGGFLVARERARPGRPPTWIRLGDF